MKKFVLAIAALLVLALGYWLLSPLWHTVEIHEPLPSVITQPTSEPAPAAIREPRGVFVSKAHEVSGVARILPDEPATLRFEQFKTENGPDLFVYLATDESGKNFINVGALKGTIGEANYPIPAGTDVAKYSHVLIWCKTFSVLFGAASLK